ncbi:helix-turn-helix domain-containing protein [Nodosilinea nodulosa]|uniref:helix-turn-helix domain-containing protein n=1 Tax=Nodosilinea nodulosa TaxID=416001 RepID=UPI0002F05883|nr:helix-turn-helix transcriptional regulator [Nodosilinea nodulosa]
MENSNRADIKILFGKAVRRRRRELDISQEALAERAGMNRTYVSSVERGERNPTLESIDQFAKALNITVSRLFVDYGIEDAE